VDTRTTTQREYAEDWLENGLMWMFEKGLPMYYSKVSLEELAILSSPDGDTLSTEERSRLRNHKDIDHYFSEETKVKLDDSYISPREPFCLLYFVLKGSGDYNEVDCYLRDIQDTVIEYWVVVRKNGSYRAYDRQLFFITVADTITAPRRVAIRSDQFVESAEVGGRTIQFPRDNLYILSSLDACAFPKSYLNSDLADYDVVMEREKNSPLKKPYDPSLKKIGRAKRFFYSLNNYDRGYIGKSRIVRR
jgi:hypothetical protein